MGQQARKQQGLPYPLSTRGMTMSTTEFDRSSSQSKQENSKQGSSTRAQHSQSDERRKPLPFEVGEDGAPEVSSNPKLPPPGHDF